ncbi:hypothetical protein CEXT_292651 [Caerostris extrusa]|uniref:Uncharacterized protein n=1 Tax=Caerostris extrusa TaxID=172846 RepID=A0AAV4W8X3_CAEEX|nr:hypothetical protein CEXT_292651 [Caerostris extrusa]
MIPWVSRQQSVSPAVRGKETPPPFCCFQLPGTNPFLIRVFSCGKISNPPLCAVSPDTRKHGNRETSE